MKCPKCGHDATLNELKDNPDTCPKCGIVYQKYIAMKQALSSPASKKAPKPSVLTTRTTGKPQEVVVTDIKMSFTSMVVFMVKWAFAAIPAVIIIAVIWMFIVQMLKVIFSG